MCIYVYICVYMYTCVYMYIYVYICIYKCISVNVCIHILHICVHVCMNEANRRTHHISIHMSRNIALFLFANSIAIYIYIYIYTSGSIHTDKYVNPKHLYTQINMSPGPEGSEHIEQLGILSDSD